jgi:hypothetical protein
MLINDQAVVGVYRLNHLFQPVCVLPLPSQLPALGVISPGFPVVSGLHIGRLS